MSRWTGSLAFGICLGLAGCNGDSPGVPTDGAARLEAGADSARTDGRSTLEAGGEASAPDAGARDAARQELGGKDGPKPDATKKQDGGLKLDSAGKPDSAPPPPTTCTPPIKLVDTSTPAQVVGSGTAASCSATALAAAVQKGGIVTFNCGASAVTIPIGTTIVVPPKLDTVIDGGGKVTLDGQGKARILEMVNPNYRTNTKKLVLQRLTLQNGKAPGSGYVAPSTTNPKCAYGYKEGSGGAVYVRDAVLQVIDCVFKNNQAATPGPDVGGGAIYVLGSLGATVVGSSFSGNQGSNGGAVGLLQTTGTFVNTVLENNKATGTGANYVEPGCVGVGHPGQGGAGGNGGAISIDGADDLEQYFCGVTFSGNTCNEYGGCVFRTANGQQRKATFLRSTLSGNQAGTGGGCLYISNSELTISQCLVANNVVVAGSGGGLRTELNTLASIVNTTFYGNSSSKGLAGAVSHPGPGEIRNCTFAANKSEGGPAYFTAALGPAGPVVVHNTVFLGNTTKDPWNPQACWFQPKTGAHNFQWPKKRSDGTTDDTACVTGITWADALLGPLADNGGPTLSLLPKTGSPVIGAGASCPSVDQRGQPRSTSKCAAGAVEP